MDSQGNVHERQIRPEYITKPLISMLEERWSCSKEPFIIDSEGFIIYLDVHLQLWEELENNPTPPTIEAPTMTNAKVGVVGVEIPSKIMESRK